MHRAAGRNRRQRLARDVQSTAGRAMHAASTMRIAAAAVARLDSPRLLSRSQGSAVAGSTAGMGCILYPVAAVQPTIRPPESRSSRPCPTADHPSVTRCLLHGGHSSEEAMSGWMAVYLCSTGRRCSEISRPKPFCQQSLGGQQTTFRGVLVRT